jgi:hypothetical protein
MASRRFCSEAMWLLRFWVSERFARCGLGSAGRFFEEEEAVFAFERAGVDGEALELAFLGRGSDLRRLGAEPAGVEYKLLSLVDSCFGTTGARRGALVGGCVWL